MERANLRLDNDRLAPDRMPRCDSPTESRSVTEKGVLIRIDNLTHLVAAYGEEAGICARAALCGLLCEMGCRVVCPVNRVGGYLAAFFEADLSLDALRRRLAHFSFMLDNDALHLAVTLADASTLPADKQAETCAWSMPDLPDFAGEPVSQGDSWAQCYRADMEKAALIIGAMTADRINLSWQPVGHPADDAVLYHECLAHVPNRTDSEWPPEDYLPSIERLGLTHILDDYVLTRVLDELESGEDVVLAANISALSARPNPWWDPIIERLKAKPSLASRLVIEITETAALPSISQAISFVEAFHALGCRIALDDFGVGRSSIRQLLSLRPDMVKINRFFVVRARSTEGDAKLFQRLVTLASSLAPIVIVEGIETPIDSKQAMQAGAAWQQGYHLGRPSFVRPWRLGPVRYLTTRSSPKSFCQNALSGGGVDVLSVFSSMPSESFPGQGHAGPGCLERIPISQDRNRMS